MALLKKQLAEERQSDAAVSANLDCVQAELAQCKTQVNTGFCTVLPVKLPFLPADVPENIHCTSFALKTITLSSCFGTTAHKPAPAGLPPRTLLEQVLKPLPDSLPRAGTCMLLLCLMSGTLKGGFVVCYMHECQRRGMPMFGAAHALLLCLLRYIWCMCTFFSHQGKGLFHAPSSPVG